MPNVDQDLLIHTLGDLANTRFQNDARIVALQEKHRQEVEAINALYAAKIARLAANNAVGEQLIWSNIDANRATLFVGKLKSFITRVAKFALRNVPARLDVTDRELAMEVARKLGVTRQIAIPPSGKWKFSLTKFRAFLEQRPEMRVHFADCIEDVEEHESLTITPNSSYLVDFDNTRVSPKPATISKS